MRNQAEQKPGAGKAAGAFTNEPDPISWLLEKGNRALTVGEAAAFLVHGARAALDAERHGRDL
jgi:2-keto-3-deoxy-L-rhamnonate aldolase RhmA